jgi:TolB protein
MNFTEKPKIWMAIVMVGTGCLLASAQIEIRRDIMPGGTRPVLVSMSGFSGEAAQVIQFDLAVQGFAVTNADAAQYELSGSNDGNLQGRALDRIGKKSLVAKAYSGATLRRQAHIFVDDFLKALDRTGIGTSKIAFRSMKGENGEIYVADFDGFGVTAVTKDNSFVTSPTWAPGKLALYYTSYRMGSPTIFHHDLSSGARSAYARYGGSSLSPAVSPDGTKVAMILSKDGWPDLYVGSTAGGEPKRLTRSREDESGPCWSQDSKWICFAAKVKERRSLCRISPAGGEIQRIPTSGVLNPTEPDWSPDGKWIVFTSMMGGFEICVVPAGGGQVTQLVAGEDPSWAPNSRTVIFTRRQGNARSLSLLDVPTKQVKDISRIPGNSNSQPCWAK